MNKNTIRTFSGIACCIYFGSVVFCSIDFVTGIQPTTIDLTKIKIAFNSSRHPSDFWGELYTMNADGSDQKRITHVPRGFTSLRSFEWSPDGSRFVIAAGTGPTGGLEMYVVNADGSNLKNIGTNDLPIGGGVWIYGASNEEPTWSPDGSRIVFSTNGRDTRNIHIINVDGSHQTQLTGSRGREDEPAWSPDGRTIAYTGEVDGKYDIYTMNSNGSNQKRLTYLSSNFQKAFWSPDGSKIAFVSRNDDQSALCVIDRHGKKLLVLRDLIIRGYPAWSPDGTKLAFHSDVNGNPDIFVINIDGSGLANLTDNPAIDIGPSWSPDGSKIAFSSRRDGNYEVYVMNADGTAPIRLTYNNAGDGRPKWSPVIK